MTIYAYSALMYFLNSMIMGIIIFTLILEMRAKMSVFILFLTLHFLVDAILMLIITYDLSAVTFGFDKQPMIGIEYRATFSMIISALFLSALWYDYFKKTRR